MANQNFCLKWESFQSNVTSVFEDLRQEDELVDITLCCEGERFPAHRMMLSACSPYFRDVLKNNTCQHMMFYMKDTSACDLRALVEFIYKGCVNVSQNQLPSFIKLAESLQIRGLSGDEEKAPPPPPPTVRRSVPALSRDPNLPSPQSQQQQPQRRVDRLSVPSVPSSPPPAKRRRNTSGCDVLAAGSVTLPPPSPAGSDSTSAEIPPPSASSAPSSVFPEPPSPIPTAAASSSSDHTAATSPPPTDHTHHPTAPTLKAESVKVEKVDLTEDDEDGGEEEGSLEATLGQVAEYEGFDDSNQAMFSTDFHQHMLSTEYGGDDMAAGSSQIIPSEDGNSQVVGGVSVLMTSGPGSIPARDSAGRYSCQLCGRRYSSADILASHMKMHEGKTRCQLCGFVSSSVNNLRRHIRLVHGLSVEQAEAIVPLTGSRRYPRFQ